jgi:hypothetical protein
MIRKQVYLTPAQDQRLRTLAARWGCTEAGVMRAALDQLKDEQVESPAVRRLREAGMLVEPTDGDEDEMLSDEELDALEAEIDAWFEEHPTPLHLSEAVFEDREGR